jgi:hypothetical protein
VILDVDRDGGPIRGSLSVASGVERRFHGWLELADALEAARADPLSAGQVAADPATRGRAAPPKAAEQAAVVRIR